MEIARQMEQLGTEICSLKSINEQSIEIGNILINGPFF
jgi:hypothetical protein